MSLRLNSRKLWVTLIAMFLVILVPLIVDCPEEIEAMIQALTTISVSYIAGQGAIDTVNTYKNGSKRAADEPIELVGPDPDFQ